MGRPKVHIEPLLTKQQLRALMRYVQTLERRYRRIEQTQVRAGAVLDRLVELDELHKALAAAIERTGDDE